MTAVRWLVRFRGRETETDLMESPVPGDTIYGKDPAFQEAISLHVVSRTIYEKGAFSETGRGIVGILHCVPADG